VPHFSTDADLLAYEPRLFIDVPLPGQQRLRVTDAQLTGNVLTSATGGLAALIEHQVVTISTSPGDAVSVAIASVTDDNTLALTHAPMLATTTDLTAVVRTFEPQAGVVHDELLAAIGIDADDPVLPLTEAAVVSTELMRRLEVLGTLWRVFEAGVGAVGDQSAINQRSDEYRRRFVTALGGARVLIDTDGDGRADAWRVPAVGRLVRG